MSQQSEKFQIGQSREFLLNGSVTQRKAAEKMGVSAASMVKVHTNSGRVPRSFSTPV
jgi:Trp operon repressor